MSSVSAEMSTERLSKKSVPGKSLRPTARPQHFGARLAAALPAMQLLHHRLQRSRVPAIGLLWAVQLLLLLEDDVAMLAFFFAS